MHTTDITWAAGVIARYPTKAAEITGLLSLAVEIAEEFAEQPEQEGYQVRCLGCYASILYNTERTQQKTGREWVTALDAELLARAWAQEHSETCRAIPRPLGAGLSDATPSGRK